MTRTPRLAVSLAFLLNGAIIGAWASRIPALVDRLGMSKGTLGVVLLLLAAGAITAFPMAGWASDRFGASRVVRLTAIASLGFMVLLGLSPSVVFLAVMLFCVGMATGSMDVSMNTWAAAVEKHLGKPIMSSFHAIFSIGAGLGAASGAAAVMLGLGVFAHYALLAAVLLGAFLWSAQCGWVDAVAIVHKKAQLFSIPRGPLVAVGVMTMCATMGEGAMVDWSALFLIGTTGAGAAKAALGFTVFSVTMVSTRLLADRIIRRVGPVTMARASGVAALAGTLIAVLIGGYVPSLIGFALMGIGYAAVFPLAMSRAAADPNMNPGAAIASVATLGYGGILLGPPMIGFAAEATSLGGAFLILSGMAVVLIALARSLRS